jgi:hypothetical protein
MSNVRPLNMHLLEIAVLEWIATHHLTVQRAVQALASAAEVIGREYTNGGGVFVKLAIPVVEKNGSVGASPKPKYGSLILEGPLIQSPELEAGADATLFLEESGLMGSLEIQSRANDYPLHRHPEAFLLLDQDGNYVDLRSR